MSSSHSTNRCASDCIACLYLLCPERRRPLPQRHAAACCVAGARQVRARVPHQGHRDGRRAEGGAEERHVVVLIHRDVGSYGLRRVGAEHTSEQISAPSNLATYHAQHMRGKVQVMPRYDRPTAMSCHAPRQKQHLSRLRTAARSMHRGLIESSAESWVALHGVTNTHQHRAREVGLLAADRRRAAAAQRRWQASAGDRAVVKLGLQVLQVQREVQDVRVRDLRGAGSDV